MNRAQRRKKPAPELVGFRFFLTTDEARLVEEALEGYRVQLAELHDEPNADVRWAMERAERLRRALDAAIEGRPHVDPDAQRMAPAR